jgi:restriction system protein
MTITEAIKQVLKQKSPQTAAEIHQAIVKASLFEFKSKAAASIVRAQLRRHCEGVNTANASAKKEFRLVGSDRYALISE